MSYVPDAPPSVDVRGAPPPLPVLESSELETPVIHIMLQHLLRISFANILGDDSPEK